MKKIEKNVFTHLECGAIVIIIIFPVKVQNSRKKNVNN